MKYTAFQKCKIVKTDKGWVLEVLGAPYGGQFDGKDADGEYFSERTDFMMDVGDARPAIYYHGRNPDGIPSEKPEAIGVAKASRRDSDGLWFEVILDRAKNYAARIYKAAVDGIAAASSGAVPHLVRIANDGEILTWPIGEMTVIDKSDTRRPANELAVATLKTMFTDAGLEYPEALLKSEELKSTREPERIVRQIIKEEKQWPTKSRAILKKN